MDILFGKNKNIEDNSIIINTNEIRNIFKEFCENNGKSFSEIRFQKFQKFLEIDFYDWVKDNLNQFEKQ
ncbi:MAG: hypothetical protein ABID79_01000 [Elusimicrobiota bacterium]